ncbi:MAG: bifunctional phosphoribosyl-AMP cyclohydrolase/phosphoribosyl-ATP diphosphatase HisIE [Candidatus Cryptobacteroides sp.]
MIKFEDLKKGVDGLVPAIVQDQNTLQVLMLGYMDAEALAKTQETGLVTFWSRSQGKIWTKGETSGNYLHLVSMAVDCDRDTLLVRAIPDGPTCHTGSKTCWGDAVPESQGFIRELEAVVRGRHEQMPEKSYTTSLFKAGTPRMAQKVGEEAVETVIEAVKGDDERMIYEASDLIYHLLVLLVSKGYGIADLETELVKRHK